RGRPQTGSHERLCSRRTIRCPAAHAPPQARRVRYDFRPRESDPPWRPTGGGTAPATLHGLDQGNKWGLNVKNRPLSVHEMRGAILLVASVEKHITKNCVRLRRMWEVFAHRLDAWQPSRRSGGDDQCSCHQLENQCAMLSST